MDPKVEALIQGLQDPKSPKRRSAAKALRKLGNPDAGPALMDALEAEISKPETWETKYQLAMALGECEYHPAIPRLWELLTHKYVAETAVASGVADALVRLDRSSPNDPSTLLKLLKGPYDWHIRDGALRATAMLQLTFEQQTIDEVLSLVKQMAEENKYWAAMACTCWTGAAVEEFLELCDGSEIEHVREGAAQARTRKFKRPAIH